MFIAKTQIAYEYSASVEPVGEVDPGASVGFETHDARAGSLLNRPVSQPFELPRPTPGKGNPVTGPVLIRGANAGDTLVVVIRDIELGRVGWSGGHAHVGPMRAGTIKQPIGRTTLVERGVIEFSDAIRIPVAPMIGCIGTAPLEPISTALAGRHGGNIDQPVITKGAIVHLPVAVPGGLLSVGDVHAAQGDGEISGVALEISAHVSLDVDVRPQEHLTWPWLENAERIMVLTAAATFEEARAEAVEAMVRAVQARHNLAPADALGLLSICGDLRIGASFGGPQTSLRLEVPISLDIRPTP